MKSFIKEIVITVEKNCILEV